MQIVLLHTHARTHTDTHAYTHTIQSLRWQMTQKIHCLLLSLSTCVHYTLISQSVLRLYHTHYCSMPIFLSLRHYSMMTSFIAFPLIPSLEITV